MAYFQGRTVSFRVLLPENTPKPFPSTPAMSVDESEDLKREEKKLQKGETGDSNPP